MRTWITLATAVAGLIVVASACHSPVVKTMDHTMRVSVEDAAVHEQKVMTSAFCATCHPAIYAEHQQNTHGRAFTDEEVRLATGRFDHGDCIRCHTPRPIFETGIGQNPIVRHHNLEEGNHCMSCHWSPDTDYSQFHGGLECKTAFADRVGDVEACASCHRNHGTPYQWEIAPTGKLAGKDCVTCHMPLIRRPVAVGEKPRMVRAHTFPGARSEKQVRRAYSYDATVEGDHVVVRVKNKGAGHHFPTELKQRSLESLVIVRDADGNEQYRSRMVFRDPYKRPYGLHLPVNTQIKPGQTREHRVPLKFADGLVDCELHFKHYFPIEDHHPTLARQLEAERLEFSGVTPSDEEVASDAAANSTMMEGISAEQASPAQLVDFQKWVTIPGVPIPIPDGDSPEDIEKLISLFQFPVPEGNRRAQDRLTEIGMPAVPALIEALGSWDNKTFKQASSVLKRIGLPAAPAILDALSSDELYVRYNARALVAAIDPGSFLDADKTDAAMRERVVGLMREACGAKNALDRRSALDLAIRLRLHELNDVALELTRDRDPDVVMSAAECLAVNKEKVSKEDAVEAVRQAMRRMLFPESRRALAVVLADFDDPSGVTILLDGLLEEDDLIREDFFESFFLVTGKHGGFNPFAEKHERLAAISRLRAWWAKEGGSDVLRWIDRVPPKLEAAAWGKLSKLADPKHDSEKLAGELAEMGSAAVPALVRGMKYPPGFADRRAWICEVLRRIGSPDAAPSLIQALDDPVLRVADWACFALQYCADESARPAVVKYRDRLKTLNAQGRIPAGLDYAAMLDRVNRTLELFE